jgi:hypothetical protein
LEWLDPEGLAERWLDPGKQLAGSKSGQELETRMFF